jgi:hypothetical protein
MTRHPIPVVVAFVLLIQAQMACIPQDCIGSTLQVVGRVQDNDGNPIPNAKLVIDLEGYSDQFHQTLTTDADGRFASDSFMMFACDTLHVKVRAEGFNELTQQFHGINEGFPDELPDELTISLFK